MNHNHALAGFRDKFRTDELSIVDYKYWRWSLRPAQSTLGAGIIYLNRPSSAWSDVDRKENAELTKIIRDIEGISKRLFSYDKINYLMLMMIDAHVHFHIFPRYSSPRAFAGQSWVDQNWPKPPDLAAPSTEKDTLEAIRDVLRKGK